MNVVSLFPGQVPASLGQPNEALIQALEDALEMAKSGRLQSLWGTGFTSDECRFSLSVPGPTRDVYRVLGAIHWLGQEYVSQVSVERSNEEVS